MSITKLNKRHVSFVWSEEGVCCTGTRIPRPFQVEDMADSVCQNGCAQTGSRIAVGIFRVFQLHRDEVGHEVAHIATDVGPGDILQRQPGVFEALKDHFEQFSLLWVHVRSLEVIDAEEGVLKRPDVFVDKIASSCVQTARAIAVRVVEPIDIEPGGREPTLGRSSRSQEVPELGAGGTAARQATS